MYICSDWKCLFGSFMCNRTNYWEGRVSPQVRNQKTCWCVYISFFFPLVTLEGTKYIGDMKGDALWWGRSRNKGKVKRTGISSTHPLSSELNMFFFSVQPTDANRTTLLIFAGPSRWFIDWNTSILTTLLSLWTRDLEKACKNIHSPLWEKTQ